MFWFYLARKENYFCNEQSFTKTIRSLPECLMNYCRKTAKMGMPARSGEAAGQRADDCGMWIAECGIKICLKIYENMSANGEI